MIGKTLPLLFLAFSCQLKTHGQQVLYFFIRYATIQSDAQPVFFVHVVCREISRLTSKGANQNWVTLYCQHIYDMLPRKSQLVCWHLHNQAIPLTAVRMTEDSIPIVPRIIRPRSVGSLRPCKKLLSVHNSPKGMCALKLNHLPFKLSHL